nr:GMC family oxidoreductase N-terminal domain-containing protein [Aminobacter niigataensis]
MEASFDVVIVGAGSAGCAIANRLSADGRIRVCLVEAGRDFPPGDEPTDILDSYAGNAYVNADYRWKNIVVGLNGARPGTARKRTYEQGCLVGGTSSINGQVAVRGASADYDSWAALGAKGWGWADVEPYFIRLEKDLDFHGDRHGDAGAIPIRRIPRAKWDPLSSATAEALSAQGFGNIDDLNGPYVEGYGSLPISNANSRRVSAAIGYLGRSVRDRSNLTILSQTQVERIQIDQGIATGIVIAGADGRANVINGRHIVVSAGVMNSPKLLMLSGIGDPAELAAQSLGVNAALTGVGRNLQDHPAISFSAYLPSRARFNPTVRRHSYINFRYSSGIPDCPDVDMVMNPVSRSAWHPLGSRLATFQFFVGKPFSRGQVKLASPCFADAAEIDMNFLSDRRDCLRLMDAMKRGARLVKAEDIRRVAFDAFPSSYTPAVQKIGAKTFANRLATVAGAMLMDSPSVVRRAFIKSAITRGLTLDGLVADERELEDYVRDNVSVGWHACGTCRMGAPDDPQAVVDPSGNVRDVQRLWVGDASIMPEIPRANINISTIMIGEKISDHIRAAIMQELVP